MVDEFSNLAPTALLPHEHEPEHDGQIAGKGAVLTVGSWTGTRTVGFPAGCGRMMGRGRRRPANRPRGIHRMVMEEGIIYQQRRRRPAPWALCVWLTPSHKLQTATAPSERLAVAVGGLAAAAVPIRAHGVMPGIVLMLPLLRLC